MGPREERTHSALEKVNTVSPRKRRVRAWQLQLLSEDSDLVLVKQAQDQLLMEEPRVQARFSAHEANGPM